MVAHPTYIIRRATTLVFRRRVPLLAQTFYKKTFFSFSLRTHLISEARRRAAIAARFTDDLIGLIEMCGADMLNERQLDIVVDDLMRFEVATSEALRETCGPRGPEAVVAAVRLHESTRETMRAALVYNDYEAVSVPLDRTLSRLGIPVEPAGEDWSRCARRAARALIEVADENIQREQGIYRADARLQLMNHASSHTSGASHNQAAAASFPPLPTCPGRSKSLVQPTECGSSPVNVPEHDLSSLSEPPHALGAAPSELPQSPEVQPEPVMTDTPVKRYVADPPPATTRAVTGVRVVPCPPSDGALTSESRFSEWFADAIDR
jgi:hypothetical protein